MRRILLIMVLCLLAVALTGCKKARLRAQLKELMSSTIVLPEKITCVYNGEVFPMPDSLRDKDKLIVFLDSAQCSSCEISHLAQLRPVYELSKEGKQFETIVLLSMKKNERDNLLIYLKILGSEYPVYCDIENRFRALNPHIPDAPEFHNLLIGEDGSVVFVGSPILDGGLSPYFLKSVNSINNNKQ